MLQTVASSGPAAVAAEMVQKLLGDTTRRTRPVLMAEVHAMIEAQSAAAVPAAVEVLLTPPSEAQQIAAAIPRARLVRIDDAVRFEPCSTPSTRAP